MLNYIKNTFTNFASYMLGLNEQLKNAKNDAERVKILNQIVEAQRKRIDELNDENSNLKEENAKLKESNDLSKLKESLIGINREAEEAEKELDQAQALIEIITIRKIN